VRRLLCDYPLVSGLSRSSAARSQEALTIAGQSDHPFSLAAALHYATIVHLFRREAQAVQQRADVVIGLATEQGFPHWAAVVKLPRGWALAEQGYRDEGIAEMSQSLTSHQRIGSELGRAYGLALIADAYRQAGRAEEGLHLLHEALALVDGHEERWCQAELYRLQGELFLACSTEHGATAETCFQQALIMAHQQQAKGWELRAALSLSRLWQLQGRTTEARQLLAPIYSWFTEGFDTPDLQEAKMLLHAVS
jgi:predicted ATPase